MNFREMNRRVFERKPIPHVFFQPRFEPWYSWHTTFNSLPAAYRNMTLIDLYDHVNVSMRTIHYYTGIPDPIERSFTAPVMTHSHRDYWSETRIIETPYGDLVEEHKRTQDDTWRQVGFPVKGPDDFKKLRWLLARTQLSFDVQVFDAGSQYVGERGEPSFWVPKSPYQALAQQWMRLEDLIFALADCRAEVEETMQVIDESYDGLYEELTGSGRLTY